MKNRNEYLKEYKKAQRAKKRAERLTPGNYYLSMSCISLEEAEKRGSGACNGWAVVSCIDAFTGAEIGELFDRILANLDKNSNIFVDNLSVWGRFIVSEAIKRGFVADSVTAKKRTYRILIDPYGKWLTIQINIAGSTAYIKDFHGIIKSSLNEAQMAFLESDADISSNLDAATVMQQVHSKFEDLVEDIAGVRIHAGTIAGYAKKLLYAIYGDGDMVYGRRLYLEDFPELPREIMDKVRDAKVYRGGLNYMPEAAKKYTGECFVYDRRSFYPFIYSNFALPYGKVFERDFLQVLEAKEKNPEFDDEYYVIYDIGELVAETLPGGVPCIQIINSKDETKYLDSINYIGDGDFMLDSNDINALYENYYIKALSISTCYVWRKKKILPLEKFGRLLYEIKENNDDAVGIVAKYLINSITGQFGANAYRPETVIVDGKYLRKDITYKGEKGYLPVAICINSKGRQLLASDIGVVGCKYLYGDTDSIITAQRSEFLEKKSGYKMGQYSGKTFKECKFIGRKCYGVKSYSDAWKWVIAGASPEMLKELEGSDVYAGAKLTGGYVPKMFDDMTIAFKEREYTVAKNGRVF